MTWWPGSGRRFEGASRPCEPAAPPNCGCPAETASPARPAAAALGPHHGADHLPLVPGQHRRGRRVGRVPRVAVQAAHPPCRDRVKRQALDQRVGILQPPVLDPGPALEDPEILLDLPTGLVPTHDPFRPRRRRSPLARQQQPLQRFVSRRRLDLQNAHRPRRHRTVRRPVLRRLQFHPPDAQLGLRRPLPARPLPALRVDRHLPPGLHRHLEVRLRRQRPPHRRLQLRVPDLHPPPPARVRPHQPRLVRMRRLPLQQSVNVALPVPDHHHPRPGTRPPQRPALIESPEPAPTLLLKFRRRFRFRPRPRLQPAHPQRPPPLGEHHRRMHEQTPRAARPLPKRSQPRRALPQTRVVQRRRVLHQQYRRLRPAALHQRLPMRLQDVLAVHLASGPSRHKFRIDGLGSNDVFLLHRTLAVRGECPATLFLVVAMH